jgi:ATP-dependent DNA ligase
MYYAFGLLVRRRGEVMKQPLSERRELLASIIQPGQHVSLSQVSNGAAGEMRGILCWDLPIPQGGGYR